MGKFESWPNAYHWMQRILCLSQRLWLSLLTTMMTLSNTSKDLLLRIQQTTLRSVWGCSTSERKKGMPCFQAILCHSTLSRVEIRLNCPSGFPNLQQRYERRTALPIHRIPSTTTLPHVMCIHIPNFSSYTFTNCVFQLAAPIPVRDPPAVTNDFGDVDPNDFFDF